LVATGSIAGGIPVTRPFPDSICWPVMASPVLVTESFYVVWSRGEPGSSDLVLCCGIVPSLRRGDCGRWLQLVPDRDGTLAAPVTGSAKAPKAIVVSMSYHMLWAYRGDPVELRSYVSTGRAGSHAPLGSFAVVE
jgi:hypothetical protein